MADPGGIAQRDIARRVRVFGRVQGVFFRAATRDQARRLGVAGSVRNCPDGSVEALFEGPADAVARAVAFCRHGPAGARVDRVEIAAVSLRGRRGFSIDR